MPSYIHMKSYEIIKTNCDRKNLNFKLKQKLNYDL